MKELKFNEQEREYSRRNPKSSEMIIQMRTAEAKARKRRAVAEYVGIAFLFTAVIAAAVMGYFVLCMSGC